MMTNQSPTDAHPFRCRADHEREASFARHYSGLGNAAVIAALMPRGKQRAATSGPTIEPVVHDC